MPRKPPTESTAKGAAPSRADDHVIDLADRVIGFIDHGGTDDLAGAKAGGQRLGVDLDQADGLRRALAAGLAGQQTGTEKDTAGDENGFVHDEFLDCLGGPGRRAPPPNAGNGTAFRAIVPETGGNSPKTVAKRQRSPAGSGCRAMPAKFCHDRRQYDGHAH